MILLRNLDVPRGLCNGTRLKVEYTGKKVCKSYTLLELVQILTCKNLGNNETVFIPRILMEPAEKDFDPTHAFQRLQFPVRLAYAMTINKSQGQTLGKVAMF